MDIMEERNHFGAATKYQKKALKRNKDVKGKNVVYAWLRVEANLSKNQLLKAFNVTYDKLDKMFVRPHVHVTEFHIAVMCYYLPNRSQREIRLALSENATITRKWYEENTTD